MIVGITGGTGFIGSALLRRHLASGDQVRLLTRGTKPTDRFRGGLELHVADLATDGVELRPFADGLDVLYHCAAEVRESSRMSAVQVDGTNRLVRAASGRVGRWVQLSSVGVYGPHRAGIVTEETPLNPVGPYEKSKAESDQLVSQAASQGAFGLSILRPSIVFGEGMTNRSLFDLTEMIRRGLFFFVGAPGASSNYVHVDNVVEALILSGAQREVTHLTANLSDWATLETFVETIASELGRPVPTRRAPEALVRFMAHAGKVVPGFPLTVSRVDALTNRSKYPTHHIELSLGYRHVTSIEEGLRRLVRAGGRT